MVSRRILRAQYVSVLSLFLTSTFANPIRQAQSAFLASKPQPAHLDEATTLHFPSIQESALLARQILHNESIGVLSTVFPQANKNSHTSENRPEGLAGLPIGLTDYYADCEPSTGNPTILALSIATSFKNTAAGSNVTLTVRQHPSSLSERESGDALESNSFFSAAAHPRFALVGYIERIPIPETSKEGEEELERCFTEKHPDAVAWLPGNRIHESWWARLVVEEVYWIGGFGDRAYIGWIPVDVWRDAWDGTRS